MNQVNIIGHLGRDPEMRYTPQGKAVTSFSVAVKTGFGENAYTLWFRCAAWEKQAQVCNQYLKKGSKVRVTGELTGDRETGNPKLWTRQDGSAGTNFDVTVREVEFLSPNPQALPRGEGGTLVETAAELPGAAARPDDNIPF